MPSRFISICGFTAAALTAVFAWSAPSDATGRKALPASEGFSGAHASAKPGMCGFSNTNNDESERVLSQKFLDVDYRIYSSQAAADFQGGCTLASIETVGQYFNGSGPAASVTVRVYANVHQKKTDRPGALVGQALNLPYSDATGSGSLEVSTTLSPPDPGKTYWLSVVANMSFATGGEWGWELSSDQPGAPDEWRNPQGGFAVCPRWGTVLTCYGLDGGFMGTW